jgi:ABC-2 type transport system permease protein
MTSGLVQLTLVRFREFYREPEAVFWVFIFPLLLAAGLGIAFRSRPGEIAHVAVLQGSAAAQRVATALAHDTTVRAELLDDSAAVRGLRTGRIALLVVPRPDGSIEYRYDDTRPESRNARLTVDAILQRDAGRQDPVQVAELRIRERGSRYIDFVVPGLLGMNIMGSGIWGIGFAIVDARRKKLLKRLIATPMSRAEYLMSFLIHRLLLLVIEVAALLGFAAWVFKVPLRGSMLELATICLLSALAFGGLGLLIASRPRTIEGASGLMNLVMLPMWVFSGVFFSSSNFPNAAQPFIHALPLTAVIDALRANMLEGAGFASLGTELTTILLWGVVPFFLALRLFRWR